MVERCREAALPAYSSVGRADRLDHAAMILFPHAEVEIHPEPQPQSVKIGLASFDRRGAFSLQ